MKPVRAEARVVSDGMVVEIAGRVERQSVTYTTAAMRPFTEFAQAPHLAEVFEFFLALYTVDQLSPRSAKCWKRVFELHFPVTMLAAWNMAKNDIERLVWQSTGDELTIVLRERGRGEGHIDDRAAHLQLVEARPTSIALLSDGLDSLCGAFQLVEARKHERIALVSIITNDRRAARIRQVREALQRAYPGVVSFYQADAHLDRPPDIQERSQRTRTMLAMAAGLTVAAGFGSPDVAVCENGMGILNLPVPGLQMRHHSSQVLHPSNRTLWARIGSRLLGVRDGIEYPNRFRTKGEMCGALPVFARPLIGATSSCDRPDRFDSNDNCGRCSSCLVRKYALATAGLTEHDVQYSSRPLKATPYAPDAVHAFHARLLGKHLSSNDPWPALIDDHPSLRTALDDVDKDDRMHVIASTIALLHQHVQEVTAYESLAHAG